MTTVASLLILMIFVLQFSVNQVTHNRIFQADMAVESFRDALKEEGGLSTVNLSEIKDALTDICGCGPEDILVECTDSASIPVTEGSFIYYRIRFPLRNPVAMGPALGIDDEENIIWSEQKGWVVSMYEESDYNVGDSDADDNGDSL
jgi:hypothetical protein